MPNESPNSSLLQTITRMIDKMINEGTGHDTLITLLSLLCLLHIVSRTQSLTATPALTTTSQTNSANPLQKILGELTKSGDPAGGGSASGGPSPDLLMSLLPLLNNPQIKSKLNPTNISSILGLMNNLGGSNNEKPEKKEPPAATVNQPTPPPNPPADDQEEKKELGRSLNWKTNFQNEKEV